MTELWFERLGLQTSPLSPKTVHEQELLCGYEEEMLQALEWVSAHKVFCVQGPYGHGKTTFVRALLKNVGGKRKAVFFSANRLHTSLDVNRLLYDRFGAVGRLLKIKSKGMVCVIDEAHYLTKKDISALYDTFTKHHFKSLIFVSNDISRVDFPKKVSSAVRKHTLDLQGVELEHAQQMIHNRIGDTVSQLTPTVIEHIYDRSNGRPRTFLLLCDKVCRHVVDNNLKRITRKEIDKLLKQ